MNSNKNARLKIAYDFDGVLMNSHLEAMITAYNTAFNKLVSKREDVADTFVSNFTRTRCWSRSAGEMVMLAETLGEDGLGIAPTFTESDFLTQVRAAGDLVHTREQDFFNTRQLLWNASEEAWYKLHTVYEPLWSGLCEFDPEITIITYKNAEAALALCKYFKLPVKAERLFSCVGGLKKHAYLDQVMQADPSRSYAFVDDVLRTLIEMRTYFEQSGRSVRCLYASWGYGDPSDIVLAQQNNIEALKQAELVGILKASIIK